MIDRSNQRWREGKEERLMKVGLIHGRSGRSKERKVMNQRSRTDLSIKSIGLTYVPLQRRGTEESGFYHDIST